MITLASAIGKVIESKLNGRSQQWLVNETGISKSKLSRMISGISEPGVDEVLALCRAFETTITAFLDEAYGKTTAPDPSSAMAKVIAEQQKQIDELKAYADSLSDFEDILEALPKASPGRLAIVRESLGLPERAAKAKAKSK